jgi:anti-sigma B factor antagonist
MEIIKTAEDKKLTVEVKGRLDTTTAPELEAALKESLEGVEKLTLNFAELEYISSAGLRVLLATQKTMQGKGEMIVSGVNDIVMEVFEVTGFCDILNIAK